MSLCAWRTEPHEKTTRILCTHSHTHTPKTKWASVSGMVCALWPHFVAENETNERRNKKKQIEQQMWTNERREEQRKKHRNQFHMSWKQKKKMLSSNGSFRWIIVNECDGLACLMVCRIEPRDKFSFSAKWKSPNSHTHSATFVMRKEKLSTNFFEKSSRPNWELKMYEFFIHICGCVCSMCHYWKNECIACATPTLALVLVVGVGASKLWWHCIQRHSASLHNHTKRTHTNAGKSMCGALCPNERTNTMGSA